MAKFMCMVAYTTEDVLNQEFLTDMETDEKEFSTVEQVKDSVKFFLDDYLDKTRDVHFAIKWTGYTGHYTGETEKCVFTIFKVL